MLFIIKHISSLLLTAAFLLVSLSAVLSQPSKEYIRKNALLASSVKTLEDRLYQKIKNHRLIMVGEIHGTTEPAGFVRELARLYSTNGKRVIVALEAPKERMKKFQLHPTEENLRQTTFFSKGSRDGRNSVAWANMLLTASHFPKTSFLFFDIDSLTNKSTEINRDSLMYETVNKALKEHPEAVVITLSERTHNQLSPQKDVYPMGYYFMNHPATAVKKEAILSILHLYNGGNMHNSIDGDLKIRKASINEAGVFGNPAPYEQYLLLLEKEYKGYNAIFFTRKVTASKEWR